MGGGNRSGPVDVAATLTAKGHKCDFEVETFIADVAGRLPAGANSTGGHRHPGMGQETADTMLIAHTLRGEGFDASEDGTGRGTPLVAVRQPLPFDTTQITSKANRSNPKAGDPCHPLAAQGHPPAIAFDARQSDVLVYGDMSGPLDTGFPGPAIAFSCKDHGADAADELAPTLRAMGHGESHANAGGQVAVAFAIQERAVSENPDAGPDGIGVKEGVAYTLEARTTAQAVAFVQNTRDELRLMNGDGQIVGALAADPGMKQQAFIQQGWAVRRLTPAECARLQGFPDHHSRIAWRGKAAELCPDGPQYKTYGNSMAVNVMQWLGERLAANQPEGRA
ncbi:MAG: hypothetical protein B7Z14_05780 [Bosea sp. 32-68-6]|nr:MAG: hypothetical protein B7Z14_05780 [Bosea sp. 32-68-6]